MESQLPRTEREYSADADQSSLSGGNEALRTAVVRENEELNNESYPDIRKGSAGRHRSRQGSGMRNHSCKKSQNGNGVEDEKLRSGSSTGTRSNSASSRHSLSKTHKNKTAMDTDQEKNSASEDEDNAACSVIHINSYTLGSRDGQPASSRKEELGKESKKMAKMENKLMAEKKKYVAEKYLLTAKMEKARRQFAEETTKYERELDGKRQEMQTSDLKLDEQYSALSKRMDELDGFRDELDSRFLHCLEYEKEIEEIERYLNRRQELCNSKEEDLRLVHDQLDTLHQELELDKERLERAGFDAATMAPRNRAANVRTPQKRFERDENDYILKANLRKCQSDLKNAEQTLHERNVEVTWVKQEISLLQSDKRKRNEKIKQLETQLSVALRQLKNHTNSTHLSTSLTSNRHASARCHVSGDRFKSPLDLSINQQAQLNRSLSGKEKGSMSPAGTKYLSSRSSMPNFSSAHPQTRSAGGQSRGSSFNGTASEGDVVPDVQMRSGSLTEDAVKTQPRTVSSACVVM